MSKRKNPIPLLIAAALVLCCCSRHTEPEGSVASPVTSATSAAAQTKPVTSKTTAPVTAAPETTEATKPVSADRNPLTGQAGFSAAAVGKRPVAVMVNNVRAALPQYGIADADVIFELPVEAGITRLMAVYADYTAVPDICSVRSCRYYYPILCLGMDAVYCHWGMDQTIAKETLTRTGIDRFDGSVLEGALFFRDEQRRQTYAIEHTGYLRGALLPEFMTKRSVRTDLLPEYRRPLFHFADEEIPLNDAQTPTREIQLNFSGAYYSTFRYDEAAGCYKKLHSGSPHLDAHTGTQLAFENVIILQTDIHTREDEYLMDVALSGGSGFYAANGGIQPITWTKDAETDPIRLYDASGAELTVSPGKSYIGIIGTDQLIRY
ncbi:MAG: DUF3048 domain-containing protein [Oscillospiraceae bacterium]|nr:DUF3048 domain-containing protein [Oscillospiraceae bacterium]